MGLTCFLQRLHWFSQWRIAGFLHFALAELVAPGARTTRSFVVGFFAEKNVDLSLRERSFCSLQRAGYTETQPIPIFAEFGRAIA
jgi:hypothetical protein